MEVITNYESKYPENISNIIFNEELTIFGTDQLKALSYVGPVAASVGWNGKQTRSALCVMNTGGVEGEKAGTLLRYILVTLVDCPDELKQILEKRRLNYDRVYPRENTLIEILIAFAEAEFSTEDLVSVFGMGHGIDIRYLIDRLRLNYDR